MKFFGLFLLTCVGANNLTVVEFIQSQANLTKVNASIPLNPEWSSQNVTVFVPLDANNTFTGKRPGTLTVLERIDFQNASVFHYAILNDTCGSPRVVFENYNNSDASPNQVHLRYGTGESKVVDYYNASNGQVFVIDKPIPDDANLTQAIASQSQFSNLTRLIYDLDLQAHILALQNVTFLAPTDNALAHFNMTNTTKEEITALIQYHILTTEITTNDIQNGNYSSLLGPSVFIQVTNTTNGTNITANGIPFGTPGDIIAKGVIVQPLDGILNTSVIIPVAWPNITTNSTTKCTTNSTNSSSISSTAYSTATSTVSGQ